MGLATPDEATHPSISDRKTSACSTSLQMNHPYCCVWLRRAKRVGISNDPSRQNAG